MKPTGLEIYVEKLEKALRRLQTDKTISAQQKIEYFERLSKFKDNTKESIHPNCDDAS